MLPRPDSSSPFALASLVAANLLPLAGVLWWGWSVLDVLVVYWLESGIVGALNVPKILLAEGEASGGTTFTINGRPVDLEGMGRAANASLALFFVAHYGIFWVVHGVFVFALPLFGLGSGGAFGPSGGPFGPAPAGPLYDLSLSTVALAAGSLLLSHGVSFATNYLGRGEFRGASPDAQMMEPYGRVMVLHLTVIGGAFLVGSFGSPLPALVLLVVLKTALDVRAHLREHGRATARTPPEPTI